MQGQKILIYPANDVGHRSYCNHRPHTNQRATYLRVKVAADAVSQLLKFTYYRTILIASSVSALHSSLGLLPADGRLSHLLRQATVIMRNRFNQENSLVIYSFLPKTK